MVVTTYGQKKEIAFTTSTGKTFFFNIGSSHIDIIMYFNLSKRVFIQLEITQGISSNTTILDFSALC